VELCTGAQFLTGLHRPNEAAGLHATKVYLQPLERLAIFDADPVPRLDLRPRPLSLNPQPSTLSPLALHPGSSSDRKNWPEPKWAELLRHLTDSTDTDLLMVGGEAEGERLQRLAAPLLPARSQVVQSLPLTELAHRLAVCRAFIGHDSGISHLAAAVGLPCLVLWGDTAEEIWRPPAEKVLVLRHPDGLVGLPVAEVAERLRGLLVGNRGLTPSPKC
jgi:heptosyltransferase-2